MRRWMGGMKFNLPDCSTVGGDPAEGEGNNAPFLPDGSAPGADQRALLGIAPRVGEAGALHDGGKVGAGGLTLRHLAQPTAQVDLPI